MSTDHLTLKIVRRLREPGALTRNRHFSVFETPEGRRALRIHRRVRGVERDLMNHADEAIVSVSPAHDDLYRVAIDLPSIHARRSSYLSREELGILLESEVGHLLGGAGEA